MAVAPAVDATFDIAQLLQQAASEARTDVRIHPCCFMCSSLSQGNCKRQCPYQHSASSCPAAWWRNVHWCVILCRVLQMRLQAEEALKESATLGEPVACLGCLLSAEPVHCPQVVLLYSKARTWSCYA